MQQIGESQFQASVLGAGQPVLVDFSATWCGPCRMLEPTLKDLEAEHGARVKFVKVDIDESPAVAEEYGVTGVPTLVLFKDGQEAARRVGGAAKPALASWITEHAG